MEDWGSRLRLRHEVSFNFQDFGKKQRLRMSTAALTTG